MNEWQNGIRIHPPINHCKRYCSEYPCTKQQCTMKRLITRNGKMIMAPRNVCDRADLKEYERQYKEQRITLTN